MQNNTNFSFFDFGKLQHLFNAPIVPMHPAPPPDLKIPENWVVYSQDYVHEKQKKNVDIFFSPAAHNQKPKGTIFYSLGWKTHPLEKMEAIENFQSEGYDVFTIPLVEAHNTIGTMSENISRMENLLFSDNSLVHLLRDKDAPLFVITHSTSTTVLETALRNSKVEDAYSDKNIDLIIHTNPFINARGASQSENPYLSKIYRWHARHHFNEHAGMPFLDRMFYIASGMVDKLITEDPRTRPTHGQVLEISEYGDTLLDTYNFAEASDPPVIAFISKDDDFASPAVAQKFFESKQNTRDIVYTKTGHNVLLNKASREQIIDIMNEEVQMLNSQKYAAYNSAEKENQPAL